jgi:hypothetical protein
MENHHFQWENPLFLWPFSIAMLNYQRVPNISKASKRLLFAIDDQNIEMDGNGTPDHSLSNSG